MATFLPYASCYGNKPAPLMGSNRKSFSLLGTPPCLMNRRRRHRRASPTTEPTLMQLTQLIRGLQQLPYQSTGERSPKVRGRDVSRSCHPKIFGSRCLVCVRNRNKQAG